MDSIWGEVCKTFGSDGIFDDEKDFLDDIRAIPTGSFALSDAVGIGGYPSGRIIQLAGRESSGKTLMSLMAIREWQRMSPHNWALFIDAEYTFDRGWAASLGVDLKRLRRRKINDGVQIFEFLCGVPHKTLGKPKVKKGLLDTIIEKGGAEETGLGIIVLDSIAAVQPPIEASSVAGKFNIAPMGRFLPPELRKLTPLLSDSGVMFIAINQMRIKPNIMYGDPEDTPGGSSWKHHCSLMINFAKMFGNDTKIHNDEGEQIGHRIRARIDKNKVAPPYRKCEFDISYLGGVYNVYREIADLAVKYKIVTKPSTVSYVFGDEVITKKGLESYYEFVRDNKELQKKLVTLIAEVKKNDIEVEHEQCTPEEIEEIEKKKEEG
jgi:recombination protein RecA